MLLRLAALALTLVVAAALVGTIRRDAPAAWQAWRGAEVRWGWVAGAFALGLAGHLASIAGWHRLLRDTRAQTSFSQAAKIFLVSNLGRYLPGAKAWQMSITGVLAAENRLPVALLAFTSLFHGLVGMGVGFLLLLLTAGALLGVQPAWLTFAAIGLAAVIAAPAGLRRSSGARRMLYQRFPALVSVTPRTMWTLVWTAAASWLAWGTGLLFLAHGWFARPEASAAAYLAAWIGSFLGGIIAFVAPAGLGVRDELMRTILVAGGVPAGRALILMLVTRLWATVLDVGPALIVLAMRIHSRRVIALAERHAE